MVHIITGDYQGNRIKRIAYSDLQAFTIINLLSRKGVTNIGMYGKRKESENV